MKNPKFFKELKAYMGVKNRDLAAKYYYALVKMLVKTCVDKKVIDLPDLGRFKIVDRVVHRVDISNLKGNHMYSESRIKKKLKFKPCEKLDKYIDRR